MLYRNISPFCEPLRLLMQLLIWIPYESFTLYFCTNFFSYFHTNLCFIQTFTSVISYEFSPLFLCSFRPYFNTNFSPLFARGLDHISFALPYQFSPLFVRIFYCLFRYKFSVFHTNFSPLFVDVRLPKLFCFYNLTKHSSYTLLHAVPLKQWIWL